ncbi:cytochrome c-type biogenesis protein [Poseidonocella sp. HB161398]|uniref:cytochrome c-type biogenesis protein n=1 Tax=Poseidonocella sp. HB161398 TaxID=2320855 RepID=UPI0011083E60|nr:cytochrome c-type biogenesis protein [Poseidonocella sp. HB161398]
MRLILAALMLVLALPAFAVQPDEMLSDPALESRARELSKELRCLVCRNESIDESNAGLARDLRLLVRERLVEGDSDAEVIDFVVDRYGEYVLLKPTLTGANLILWVAGPVLLLAGIGIGIGYQRRNRLSREAPAERLSEDEAARLKAILDDGSA